jgi:hypothetical protein
MQPYKGYFIDGAGDQWTVLEMWLSDYAGCGSGQSWSGSPKSLDLRASSPSARTLFYESDKRTGSLAIAPPLLYSPSSSCPRLNGAQEVEARATNSLNGGMNFGSARAGWFPGLDHPPSSNIHRLSQAPVSCIRREL